MTKMDKLKDVMKSLQTRSALAIIITAAVLIEGTSAVQYWFAQKSIRNEVQHRAETELRVKTLEIQRVMASVEAAVTNTVWAVEKNIGDINAATAITQRLVQLNDAIVGCSIGFIPNYFSQHGRWYEPYVLEKADGSCEKRQIGSAQHDYLNAEWFKKPLQSNAPYWSEPYFDDAGARMMLCSYCVPIHDATGRIIAILGADVSLDWLSQVINSQKIYPSSYNLMISRKGQIMACPVESLVLKQSIQEATSRMKDTAMNSINRQMMAGNSGQTTVVDDNGQKNYVFYAPIEKDALGWSMAVVCSDKEIYGDLRQVGFCLFLLMLAGLALMGFIIYRTIKGFKHLEEVSASKASIESELKIASGIQMAMLPKMFPPYPDRDDIDIYGQLTPAKAVGGDIFDFYIRDEKLFFCIGDVSGKGVPASLVMAVTKAQFRTISTHEAMPDRIISALNGTMAEANESNMFVTLFVGVLDLPTGRLRYCNAGHDAPMLINGHVRRLKCQSNIPVGIMADWQFVGEETIITPQTTIFLYTDGLSEAENAEHQQFGKTQIADYLNTADRRPLQLVRGMIEAVHLFVGDAEQSDDLTMLAIRYTRQQLDVTLQKSLTLSNDIQEVPRLAAFVDEVCEALSFDMSQTMNINLAIEEAVVNVINYAYPPDTKGDIGIEAVANDERLKFVITDSGKPFDPTTRAEVDTSLPAEKRDIGGLGIHLVRRLMDTINYERLNGQNVLTLRKKLKQNNQ